MAKDGEDYNGLQMTNLKIIRIHFSTCTNLDVTPLIVYRCMTLFCLKIYPCDIVMRYRFRRCIPQVAS